MTLIPRIGLFCAIAITSISSAFADACAGGARITGEDLAAYIRDNLTCAYEPDTDGSNANKRWSSVQDGDGFSGTLFEYARGYGDPVDPTKNVGTWALVNDSNAVVSDVANATRVRYKYGSSYTYHWEVWATGGSPPYQFCDPADSNKRIAYAKSAVTEVTPGSTTGNKCKWPNF